MEVETNVWESPCRRLRASSEKFGEDGLRVKVNFK
jgi:hypothetical protein